jgi:hypothetical protein
MVYDLALERLFDWWMCFATVVQWQLQELVPCYVVDCIVPTSRLVSAEYIRKRYIQQTFDTLPRHSPCSLLLSI